MEVILTIIAVVTILAIQTTVKINGKEIWNGQKHVRTINIKKNINL